MLITALVVVTYIIHEQSPPPGGYIRSVCISRVKLEICTIRAVAKRSATLKLQAIANYRAKLIIAIKIPLDIKYYHRYYRLRNS